MAHFWGDHILTPLATTSEDFKKLDGRNSYWVAEVLAQNSSSRSRQLSLALYQRNDILAKLVGAIGLAAHGDLSKDEFSKGILHEVLTDDRYIHSIGLDGTKSYVDTTPVELALVAAKYSKSKDTIQDILAILEKHVMPYWVHAYACDAIAEIKDNRAIRSLEAAMRSHDFYALPNAFLALIALSDINAIPLAIDRISPEIKDKNSGFVVQELEKVTGQKYGFDKNKWQHWWSEESNSVQIVNGKLTSRSSR